MKLTLKAKSDKDKSAAAATLAFKAGDVKLRASMTEATIVNGPSFNGLFLAVEKPGNFIIEYNVPKKDVRFQFMNTVKVAEKPLNVTYTHLFNENKAMLDGTLVIDSANKISANHVIGSPNCRAKYTYVHNGTATFEPCYDFVKNSWDFAVSKKVYDDHVYRAMYNTSSNYLGLEWSRSLKKNGSLKLLASVNLAEEKKVTKLTVETGWDFEL